jgi:hypothetical protein
VKPGGTRAIVAAFVAVVVAAGGFYFYRSFERPAGGKSANVADAPAGGRTQAQPDSSAPVAVVPPGDPLLPGIPESPDIPADASHSKIKKAGERIREAVLADGTVGDYEAPGIDFTGLTQRQRNWYLNEAVAITCSCGCKQDLLECRRDDATCPLSPQLSDSLLAAARQH